MKISSLAVASSALFLVGAASGAHAANPCFNLSNIANSRASDDHTLYVRVGGAAIYRLDMQTQCPDLQNSKVILRSVSGSGNICNAIDLDLKVGDEGFRSACVVGAITKLTPGEAAALPSKIRP
jgi:hypothetical protein